MLLSVGLMMAIPAQLFPDTDEDTAQISIEMVPGTTLKQTEQVADAGTQEFRITGPWADPQVEKLDRAPKPAKTVTAPQKPS